MENLGCIVMEKPNHKGLTLLTPSPVKAIPLSRLQQLSSHAKQNLPFIQDQYI